ncbi:MAG: GH3 auxin-responsive promoter family protein, partial [Bacteroidaceae bacterium]
LQPLQIIVAPNGLFDQWLKSKGKLGGQHKVPRLANDRKIIDEVLAMIDKNHK